MTNDYCLLVSQHDSFAECARGESHAALFKAGHETGADPCGDEVADCPAPLVDAFLVVFKDVLHHDRVLLHTHDFGDVRHLTSTALHAVGLNDQVHCIGDLLAHGAHRHFEAAHHDHGFEPGDGVARCVGVASGERPIVARVHGLEHVECFGAAALADDDSIRPHTQTVAHEVGGLNLTLAFDVRGASF